VVNDRIYEYPRTGHSATLLANGQVLVAGGHNGVSQVNSAELYDPTTGTWSTTGSFSQARSGHTAFLLNSGKVLIAAGSATGSGDTFGQSSADLYDPVLGTWSQTGSLAIARMNQVGLLLADGRGLVCGGQPRGVTLDNFSSCETYDPALGTWSQTGPMALGRRGDFTLTLLPSGKVLVAGGTANWTAIATNRAELFDPVTRTWSPTAPLPTARAGHTATLLDNGTVLVAAGNVHPLDFGSGTYVNTVLIFDPEAQTWSQSTATLAQARGFHLDVRLDRRVLLVGGTNGTVTLPTAEIFVPGGPINKPDTDRDGVPDELDNCPGVPNPNQLDSNLNGIGDACEPPDLDHSTAAFLQALINGSTTVEPQLLPVVAEPTLTNQLVRIVAFRVAAGLTPSATTLIANLVDSLVEVGLVSPSGASALQNAVLQQVLPTLTSLGPATLWIGLKNSDDQGTQFDLRAEVYIKGKLVSAGETRCITGVTRNPDQAKQIAVPFGAISEGTFNSGDTLSVKILTRIGTNTNGTKYSLPGGSHNNAVGLRLYYDAVSRSSRFGTQINSNSPTDTFLHSGGNDFLDNKAPSATSAKFKDSPAVNFNNGNPWQAIGTWSMTLP